VRGDSDKIFRDNQITYIIMFNNFSLKIVLFMKQGGKIW